VGLSHALEIPLLLAPTSDALIVDDVYETGRTLEAFHEQFSEACFAVWVSERPPRWWITAELSDAEEWLVFPWENSEKASAQDGRTFQIGSSTWKIQISSAARGFSTLAARRAHNPEVSNDGAQAQPEEEPAWHAGGQEWLSLESVVTNSGQHSLSS